MTTKTRKALIADARRLLGQLCFAVAAPGTAPNEAAELAKAKEKLTGIIADLERGAGGQ